MTYSSLDERGDGLAPTSLIKEERSLQEDTTESESRRFMNVKQVAEYLHLNEKKVYALVGDGQIPATKVTGKWLFPRDLVDQWLLQSSHGGLLTDRIVLTGSDDPLLYRSVIHLTNSMQSRALVSYTCAGTQLGLSLLSRHRADICGIHWGPVSQSYDRHPALIRAYPQHHDWVVVRAFHRQQGLILAPGFHEPSDAPARLFSHEARWAMRQEGAGSNRFLQELLVEHNSDPSNLNVSALAYSEREAASLIAMGSADVGPGTRSAATEFGLAFLPIGWEAFDLVLYRGVYFRALFQSLLDYLKGSDCQHWAQRLSGYDLNETGKLIWSA